MLVITNVCCSGREKVQEFHIESGWEPKILQEIKEELENNREEENISVAEIPDPYEDLMSFENIMGLRDYLINNLEHGNLSVEFLYKGSDMPDISELNRLLCIPYGTIEYTIDESGWKRVQMTEYPGTRMVRAFRTGDWSELKEEEQEALNQAVEIVEDAKQRANTPLELELLLHDWLCDHIVYDETGTDFSDPSSIPHHLTAIGALLDGSANCQGYTDGFYVLGNLAGFRVERMSCVNKNNGEHHIMNVIQIDGIWSVVDVTYDDGCGEGTEGKIYNYRMFNAGEDIVRQENDWEEIYEIYPLTEVTTDDYFYYTPEVEISPYFGRAFTNIKEMAENVAERFMNHSDMRFYMMLQGRNADWVVLKDALVKELTAREKYGNIYVTYVTSGIHTYYEIRIY